MIATFILRTIVNLRYQYVSWTVW